MRPAYLVSLVACALLLAVVLLLQPQPAPPPLRATDWETVAVCVWERWDQTGYQTFGQQASILRFCALIYPQTLQPPG